MVIRNQTILFDTFIELLDDEVNKLNKEQVNYIFTDIIDDFIPESEDNSIENHKENSSK